MARVPLLVSFDNNAYSVVARPQIHRIFLKNWPLTLWRSKQQRILCWYIRRCVVKGRIVAAIPEAAFAAELFRVVDRIEFLRKIGTPAAATRPDIPPTRARIIAAALKAGFKILHGGRIAYGDEFGFAESDWAADMRFDIGERQNRMSHFIRHFNDVALSEFRAFGQRCAVAHNITSAAHVSWRDGLVAEKRSPKLHRNSNDVEKAVRLSMSNWADFDIAAAHYAYGYDYLCTQERIKDGSSIFGSRYANGMQQLGITRGDISNLAAICWARFGFPSLKWKSS